jgi:uncharacterized protein (DUF1499 family)
MFKFSGTRPSNLGVKDGKLTPCPDSPNCVCSCFPQDATHAIEPLTYRSNQAEAIAALKQIIRATDRAEIIIESPDYIYAEFTSKLMGYVDDVEFYGNPSENSIQVRSASRLGKSDLGANRKRIEAIRAGLTDMGV